MCGGGSTKVKKVPYGGDTTTSITLPDWLTGGSQQAVEMAQGIADKPFTPYTGQLVADLAPNQNQAIDAAANSGNVGQDALNTGMGTLENAANFANSNMNTGVDALSSAQGLYDTAGNVANYTMDAGLDQANKFSNMADLTSIAALNGMDTGQGDIDAARNYTTAYSGAITPDMISQYFNPYVSMALDPVAQRLEVQSAQKANNIAGLASQRGAFGNSRTGLLEGQNEDSLKQNLSQLYGQGYSTAWDKAMAAATDQMNRRGNAANLSLQTADTSRNAANDSISRMMQAAGLQSDSSKLYSGLATDAQGRLIAAGDADSRLAAGQNDQANSAVNRALSTTQVANQTAGQQSDQINDYVQRLVQTGQIDQAQAQDLLDAMYGQFQREQNYPTESLETLLSALSTVPYGVTETGHTSGFQGQLIQKPSMLSQIMGGVAAGAGALGAIGGGAAGGGAAAAGGVGALAALSDRRAKKDIARLGTTANGLPLYAFRYIGDEELRFGLMADDVESVNADAVFTLGNGLKAVRYDLALGL